MPIVTSENNWRDMWDRTKVDEISEWDQLSNIIFSFFEIIIRSFEGKRILEAGSGTGRISIKMAQLKGAESILIDISRKIIKHSRDLARRKGIPAKFIVASIFALPIKSECLDIVWNSGVLEHFNPIRQQFAISETMRCLKKLGKNILIVPNKKALFYNCFRVLSKKLGEWPFCYEKPLSKNDLNRMNPKPSFVYSIGFLQQFFVAYVPYISVVLKGFLRLIESLFGIVFHYIDLKVSGYLLIGIFIKR